MGRGSRVGASDGLQVFAGRVPLAVTGVGEEWSVRYLAAQPSGIDVR